MWQKIWGAMAPQAPLEPLLVTPSLCTLLTSSRFLHY